MSEIHFNPGCHGTLSLGSYFTACGAWREDASSDRTRVTCKRCLASLAKRDRDFRRKARRGLAMAFDRKPSNVFETDRMQAADAARAVAREEGRTP